MIVLIKQLIVHCWKHMCVLSQIRFHHFIYILALSLSLPFHTYGQDNLGPNQELFRVDEIKIIGTRKVEPEAIFEKIFIKKGSVLNNYILRDDIKTIYSMKYFDSVKAYHDQKQGKNILTFEVHEKPLVQKIEFEGNSELSKDDLKEKIKTKEFSILDVNTIKSDLVALQKFYEEKGYYLASFDYEIEEVSAEQVRLVYKIKEYDRIRVKKITILGNTAFQDDELKGIMETREENLFSFMSGSGNFKEFNFQTDIERIKYFYKTKGYLQINVGTPQVTVSEDKRWLFITLKVNEGPKFDVNKISFSGDLIFTDEKLREKIKLGENQVYSEETLRKDIQNLTELYQDEGYAFVNVLRTLQVVPGEHKVDVEFIFEKGKIAYFGKIIMKGNTKTRDKVIRRELKIEEGMRFSGSKLRESKENVNRLGFFEPQSVIFNTVAVPGKEDALNVEISVKERNTGQITLGAGYSTASGGFIQAQIAQKNFRGLGQELSFTLNMAKKNQDFRLGFIEPYLFDSKWTAGGDIFKTQSETSRSYNSDIWGLNARVGHPIFDYTRLFLVYKFEETKLSDVQDPHVNEAIENGKLSAAEASIVYDRRNNRMEPTKGHYLAFSLEYAGIGGKHRWIRSELDGRYYKNIIGDLVLRTRLFAGKMDQSDLFGSKKAIPRSRKYVLGGSRNLRGYGYEDIGPLTPEVTPDGKIQYFNEGGLFQIFGTLEFEHPLVREAGLKWVVFLDAGNVYREYLGKAGNYSVKADYGFGLRWFSPIGPLRFEFGYPIDNKIPGAAGNQFHFDIGTLF